MRSLKFKHSFFLLTILIGFISCQKNDSNIVYNKKYIDEIKKIRNDMSMYLVSNSIPGASIAVSKGGEIIYSEGMGLASKDLEVPVTRETKFRIGPGSELFTSLAYRMLVEKGTLNPDSSVRYYLPDFPKKKYKVTLENLIDQTSGIRPERENEEYPTHFNIDIQNGLNKFKNDTLLTEPGNYQIPSPLNFDLLGAVMEKATGKDFKKIIKELVIDSLNLGNTVFDNPFATIKGRSNFYDHNLVTMTINAITVDLRSIAPSKGILSNAEDLVNFGNALLYSSQISDSIKNKIFNPIKLKSGAVAENSNGWLVVRDIYQNRVYVRTGYVTGGGSAIIIFPDEELVVAIALNTTMNINEPPYYKIASYFLPEHETENPDQPTSAEDDNSPTSNN